MPLTCRLFKDGLLVATGVVPPRDPAEARRVLTVRLDLTTDGMRFGVGNQHTTLIAELADERETDSA